MRIITATLTALALAFGLTTSYASAATDTSFQDQTLRSIGGDTDTNRGWIWYEFAQCMVAETAGGSDWADASEACQSLEPTDPPEPTDPQVPDSPIRAGSRK